MGAKKTKLEKTFEWRWRALMRQYKKKMKKSYYEPLTENEQKLFTLSLLIEAKMKKLGELLREFEYTLREI